MIGRRRRAAVAAAVLTAACGLWSVAWSQEADFQLPATTAAARLDFAADRLEYDASSRTVLLSGSAEVTDSTFTLRSETVRVDLEAKAFESPAPLELSDGSTTLKAASGRFDFGRRAGQFAGLSGRLAPWSFTARHAEVVGGRNVLRGARVTSCDREPPHYRIRASRLTLIPSVRMTSWNNVFFLGRAPVLYLPFFTRSLKPDPLVVTKVHLGYDHRNGLEVQTDNTIKLGRRAYDRLTLDYYSRQGIGVGDEAGYRLDDGSRGTVYSYWIDERGPEPGRWTVLGDFWQRLGERTHAQGRVETRSDPAFNNDYFRSHTLRVSPELNNSGALVRQSALTTTRLSYSRLDVLDPADASEFRRASESVPRLDFSAAPFKVPGLPVLHNVSAFADRSIDASRSFYQDSAGGAWSVTRNFQVRRGLTLVPVAGLSGQYQDRVETGTTTLRDQTVGRYFTQVDLRARSPFGDTTLGHRHTRRLEANAFREDVTAVDRGEEQNLLTGEQSYLPSLSSRLAVSSGYDLRRDPRGAAVARRRRDRLQPVIADAAWIPHTQWTLLAREQYRFGFGHQAVLLHAEYGFPGEARAGLGFAQNAAERGRASLSTTFGYGGREAPWAVEGALRFRLTGAGRLGDLKITSGSLFEKELTLRRRWHDFSGRFSYRQRPGGVQEFVARVDLRVGKGDEGARRRRWEEEFYPWRQGLQEK